MRDPRTSLFIDSQTRQRVARQPNSGDIIYDADIHSIGSAVAMETVSVVGPWKDYTGSDLTIDSTSQQMWAGTENQLHGTDPQIESDSKLPNLDIVGNRASTTRRRIKRIYKEF